MTRPRAGGPAGPLWTGPGLHAEPLLDPNPLWASNGVAFGPDGRLYVAQFLGGTVSALDTATGALEPVLGPDGPLTAPDDLVFDDVGAMYVVDLPAELVWRRDPDGTTTVVASGIAAPDGIAWHRGRLFVNELVPDGRLLEIDLDGGPPRVLATGLVLGNAMQVGPDGSLYYPHLGGGEVWRIGLDGGGPERVAAGLDRPVAVRFDPAGRLRVLSNGTDGRLWTIDPASGSVTSFVDTGMTGADNVAFAPDGTAWVSGAFRGGIRALGPDGARRDVLPEGLNGPYGLTVGPGGALVVADWFGVARVGVRLEHAGDLMPVVGGGIVGITTRGPHTVLVTATGSVFSGDPWTGSLREVTGGLDRPTGIADACDGVVIAETGAGRVVHVDDDGRVTVRAQGLDRPLGVAVGGGHVHVTESGRGRVVRLDGGSGTVVAAGLARPEGLAADGDVLWCAEAGRGRLLRIDTVRRTSTVVASGLAFDVRPDHVPPDARSGPAVRPAPFAAVVRDGDDLIVAQNAEGTLLRLTSGPTAS